MRKWMLVAGAAALAMAVPALAGPGGGHGGGGGGNPHGGGGNPHGGPGGGRGGHGPEGGGGPMRMAGPAGGHGRGGGRIHGGGRAFALHGGGHGRGHVGVRMAHGGRHGHAQRSRMARMAYGHGRHDARIVQPGHGARLQSADNHMVRNVLSPQNLAAGAPLLGASFQGRRGLAGGGCPPGLAAKNNGCLPPGQAMKLLGTRLPAGYSNALLPYGYRSWYPDSPQYFYRYDSGYGYRVDRNSGLINEILPLDTGYGYYPVGNPYPLDWSSYNVPAQYADYYPDAAYDYRYGDGAIYQVDPRSGVIDAIVQLLAGDLGVGSRLPDNYDVYNVPMAYRDRYFDTADSWYRYNDGYIYQVDPKTRLIQQVIAAIA